MRVEGLGFRVQGLGWVEGLGFRVCRFRAFGFREFADKLAQSLRLEIPPPLGSKWPKSVDMVRPLGPKTLKEFLEPLGTEKEPK